jgi:enoyl-CoA hydratase/carnithine racemase
MLSPTSFDFSLNKGVASITLNRPDRLNALTFEVYTELADCFEAMEAIPEVRAVVLTGAGRAFCSGGDVDGIIAELFSRDMAGLLDFTRITGRLIQKIRQLRRPVIAAINGTCVGAGAVIAAACDLRIAAEGVKFGFIFPKVGLCGADMGASYLLPRIVGLGHASELLFFGDLFDSQHAARIGFVNRVVGDGPAAVALALEWAEKLSRGPAFAHKMTKQMLESEATMALSDAIEAEAQAQAICMMHPDFRLAHDAFKAKQPPRFTGAPE